VAKQLNSETGFCFLKDKSLLIEFSVNESSMDSLWMKDLIDDFDDISEDQRKEMYLAYLHYDKDLSPTTRNHRNEFRFQLKNESFDRLAMCDRRYKLRKQNHQKKITAKNRKKAIIKYVSIALLLSIPVIASKYFL
jgi:hypothetical protein